MASESRARDGGHDDDRGAGGKILRDRRPFSTAAASLYSRPVETASPPASPPRSRRWFSGIVSGAGRLISSVFRSEDDGSLCSSSESSEDRLDGDSDDAGEDVNGEGHENGEVQPSTNLQLIEDPRGDCQPLASISGSKLAIEQLLKQEIFTRYEGSRLIEIIRSRITDSPRTEDRWGTQLLEFPAVMEAKKWVEQKRSESTSKVDLSFRHCALNTNLLHHDNEYDKESPVNMAKSYMQSLPAWESPLARSSGLKPAFELYESPYTYGSSSTPSLTPMKRDSFATESRDAHALEQTRNVRQKTTEGFSKNFGPCEGTPELPSLDSHLSPGKDSSEPAAKASLGFSSMKEKSFNNVLGIADVPAKMVDLPLDNGYCNETGNTFFNDAVSTPEESLGASRRDEHLILESRSLAADKEVPIANEQHLESEIILYKEQSGVVVPNKTGILESSFTENKGLVDNFTDAEPIAMEPENLNLELPSPVESSVLEKKREAKSPQSGRFDDPEAAAHADGRSHEENEERENETSPPAIHFTSNGGSYPSSSSAGSEKVDLSTQSLNLNNHKPIGDSNGDLGTEVTDILKISPKAAIKRNYTRAKRVGKVHAETMKKDIKEKLQEAPNTSSPSSSRGRGRGGRGRSHGSSMEKQVVLRPRKNRAVKQ